jgi:uncharacterized protein
MEIALPIIEHEEYQQMKFIKHHDESVYDHSLKVAYRAYEIAYSHNLDWVSTIRGALLHDFFLYKFKKTFSFRLITDSIKHAISHPIIANIIKGHMFPFGLPKSKEAWIVSYVDKYIASFEYCSNFKKLTVQKTKAYYAK